MSKTIQQSTFDRYTKEMQDQIISQGITVVADPVETTEFPAKTGAQPELSLIPEEGEEEDESGIFANIYVTKGNKRHKLTFTSLDSDFVKYTDKENTTENAVRNAIVAAVESVGIEKANELLKFEIELTKKGEHVNLDLLAED